MLDLPLGALHRIHFGKSLCTRSQHKYRDCLKIEPLKQKWKSFGWNVLKNHNEEEDKKKDLFEKLLSRESEIKADQNGAKMMINSGYSKDTCLNAILFLSKKASMHMPAVRPAVPSIMDSFVFKDFGFKTAHFSGTRMNSENPP